MLDSVVKIYLKGEIEVTEGSKIVTPAIFAACDVPNIISK